MKTVTRYFEISYLTHKDNFTETMDGVTSLLRIIKENGNISEAPVCRAIILMSHFMIENVFWNTASAVVNENSIRQEVKHTIEENLKRKIGIAEAIEKWPKLLVGNRIDFSTDPFSSLKCLINERNDVTHKDRVSYYSYYIDTYDGAAAAYYTAIECAKAIQRHFLGNQPFKYHDFEKDFLPPKKVFFQKALSDAKNKSIRICDDKILEKLKSLEKYNNVRRKDFREEVKNIFGEEYSRFFGDSIDKCEYSILVSEYFLNKISTIPLKLKNDISKKLTPLLRTLTRRKMVGKFGVRFGEILPHIKLKILRIPFNNHHGYMCMPCNGYFIIFIIGPSDIVISDLILNA